MTGGFLDLLTQRFEELKSRAVMIHIEGRDFSVVSLDDLIAMKEVAGRPQDLLDVAELKRIRDDLPLSGAKTAPSPK